MAADAAAWIRDKLLKSRRPLTCAGCNKVIFEGELVYVEDGPACRYACSPTCSSAVTTEDAVRKAHAATKRGEEYGQRAHSDADDPEF